MSSVRPLPPGQDASKPRIRVPGALVAIAGAAALVVLTWPSGATDPRPSTVDGTSPPISVPQTRFESPAVEAFTGFVGALNQGDVAGVLGALADDLPDVTGLGTVSYPYTSRDPGLWDAGILKPESVAGFVAYLSALDGDVSVADCSGFADGPSVVIASCSYQAPQGLLSGLGVDDEAGRLFGFIVDGEVAGIAANGTYGDIAWARVERWADANGSVAPVGSDVNAYSARAAQSLLTVLETMASQPRPR